MINDRSDVAVRSIADPNVTPAGSAQVPTAQPSPPRSRRWPAGRLSWLDFSIPPALVIIGWHLVSLRIGEVVGPVDAMEEIVEGVRDGWLPDALKVTLSSAAVSFVLAMTSGLAAGVWLGLSRSSRTALETPLLAVSGIPKVTLYPFFLLYFGISTSSNVAFGAIHGFFPLVVIVMNSIKDIRAIRFRVARVYRLGAWSTFRRVIVPDVIPSIVTGLRYCFSMCLIGVVLAEMFVSRDGSGQLLSQAISLNRLERIFAVASALIVTALIINVGFAALQWVVSARRGARLDPGRASSPEAT